MTLVRLLGALILGVVTTTIVWRLTWLPHGFLFDVLFVVAALISSWLYWALFFAPGLSYDAPTGWAIAVSKWLFALYFVALPVLDYRIAVHSGVKWLLIALAVEVVATPFCAGLFALVGRAVGALVAERTGHGAM